MAMQYDNDYHSNASYPILLWIATMSLKKEAENFVEAASGGPPKPRLTAGQQSVLEALQRQPQPLSAQALYGVMRRQQPIGLATIYRALDALKLLGLVQHRVTLTGETLYSAV
nr:transcriptional repressor [Nodosilinea sp. LEGE 07088]